MWMWTQLFCVCQSLAIPPLPHPLRGERISRTKPKATTKPSSSFWILFSWEAVQLENPLPARVTWLRQTQCSFSWAWWPHSPSLRRINEHTAWKKPLLPLTKASFSPSPGGALSFFSNLLFKVCKCSLSYKDAWWLTRPSSSSQFQQMR